MHVYKAHGRVNQGSELYSTCEVRQAANLLRGEGAVKTCVRRYEALQLCHTFQTIFGEFRPARVVHGLYWVFVDKFTQRRIAYPGEPQMRVYRVRGLVNGAVEIMLFGKPDDAAYVARCLALHAGALVEQPTPKVNTSSVMYLVARGSADNPITVDIAKRLLKKHPKTGWLPTA